jgi:hypothetical protein
MHHRPSRCQTCPNVRAAHSGTPQPATNEHRQDRAVAETLV